ncbi:hypothetical protein SESBI_02625 [Sesbania bispinosa]|nr:hypothetical protein SESBI_02625 [Sesbania bispinosa]
METEGMAAKKQRNAWRWKERHGAHGGEGRARGSLVYQQKEKGGRAWQQVSSHYMKEAQRKKQRSGGTTQRQKKRGGRDGAANVTVQRKEGMTLRRKDVCDNANTYTLISRVFSLCFTILCLCVYEIIGNNLK